MTAKTSDALYVHLHRLLDEHVAVHLATNYTDYTQLRVYQTLTGGLLPVSAKDTHSLLPPSDPLDGLVQEYCRIEAQKSWEKLTLVEGAQELITRTIGAVPLERTEFLDTFCSFSPRLRYDPVPPLAVRSIRLTPKIGHSGVPRSIPVNLGGVPGRSRMESVTKEDFGCDDVGVMAEDIIHSRLTVDNHMSKEIYRSSFPAAQRSGAEYSLFSSFLYRTPSPALLPSSPQTPPLFSRINATPGKPAHVPMTMADISLITPLATGDDDDGTSEYLAITDQWSMSTMSSPPTSSDDGLREQHDLFAPSSDSREPIGDLLAAKMDTVYMPRKSSIGGFHGVMDAPGQHQSLHEYIGPIIDLTSVSNVIATPASVSSPTDNIVTSLTSAHNACATPTPNDIRQHSGDTGDDPFWFLSTNFPEEVMDHDVFDWPEETGLMEVPLLPAPNVHTRNVAWSSDLGSLLTHQSFSFVGVVKGIKSLNLELTWRPYSSEQAIPNLEELVGVSDFYHFLANAYSDTEEDKTLLADLLNMSHHLIRPISIEDENQRGIEVIICTTAESDFSNIGPASIDGSDLNVLLTRAERCQSRSLRRPRLERDCGSTGRYEGSGCNTQSHISERVVVGGLSECVNRREGTSYARLNSVDMGLSAGCHPPLSDTLSDASFRSGSGDHHVQLSTGLAATVPPASLSQDPVLVTGLETPRVPSHSWLQNESHEVDGNYVSSAKASLRLTVHDGQSLGEYLTILAQKRLPGSSHDTPHTSPTLSEQRRESPPLFDVEQLLRELTNLTTPVPPLQTPPLRNHRYLASVQLLQSRPLVCTLRHDWLGIDLLEREWLNGADIVFDCDTALVFSPLCLLPFDSGSLKGRLGSLSWKYTRLAVVFKLYGDGVSGLRFSQNEREQEDLSARVVRSFKKLCRDMAIAEAYGEKRPQTDIRMYLACSDEQAATVVRTLGDSAEFQSQWGPWGDRLWLRADEQEEEPNLANVDGMNAFAAAAILSQISLHDFLALSPDQRVQFALRIPLAEGMIVGNM